jgi:NADPH:quinone reductase-like Zn-dependent oxidoreductase
MQVAGIRRVGARVEMIEAAEPRPLAGDEVLLEVRAAGVGNWDEFVRTGGWDVGAKPPMALGVEAAGIVLAVGQAVANWGPGDAVMTHPVPLRDQGTWAPRLIAPAGTTTVMFDTPDCCIGLARRAAGRCVAHQWITFGGTSSRLERTVAILRHICGSAARPRFHQNRA